MMNRDFSLQIKLYDSLELLTKLLFQEMQYCLNNKKLNNEPFDILLRKYQGLKIVAKSMDSNKEDLKKLIALYNEASLSKNEALMSTYLSQIENLENYYVCSEIKIQQELKGWQHLYCVYVAENKQSNKEV